MGTTLLRSAADQLDGIRSLEYERPPLVWDKWQTIAHQLIDTVISLLPAKMMKSALPLPRGLAAATDGITIDTMGVAELRERAAELEQISALLAAAGSGRGNCAWWGPSGVGKSRLLDESASLAEVLGMGVLRARCSELTREAFLFGVARNLFDSILFGLIRVCGQH